MTIDIYCTNKKCPICGSVVKTGHGGMVRICKNECYTIDIGFDLGDRYYVFGKRFEIDFSLDSDVIEEEHNKIEKAIIEEIKYWKENDRYLMRIMGVDND